MLHTEARLTNPYYICPCIAFALLAFDNICTKPSDWYYILYLLNMLDECVACCLAVLNTPRALGPLCEGMELDTFSGTNSVLQWNGVPSIPFHAPYFQDQNDPHQDKALKMNEHNPTVLQ